MQAVLVRPFLLFEGMDICMGGYGSGGRNKTHGTVEKYRRIDSFELGRCFAGDEKPHEIFDPIFYGNNRFTLHWIWGVDGSRSRLYFGCPWCQRRVRYLYAYGTGYMCRHCLDANYESQQATKGSVEDIQRQMKKIVEDQLGYYWWRHDNPGGDIENLDVIPRPRYMRWAKYERLISEYRRLQDDYWRAFIREMGCFMPPEMLTALSGYL